MVVEQYDATPQQRVAIDKLCRILRVPNDSDNRPLTRRNAQHLQWQLLCRVRAMPRKMGYTYITKEGD
ncbi:MAG: hypothetical protein PHO67_07905 [Candidatus Omnitrophica bacterium]|nr:hypothetical protein [Candidatus Omnitrophota bacterium]